MKPGRRTLVFCAALLVSGALRLPVEISLTRELRAQNLLPPPLATGTRERIGQTSSAVALGGLRTLVATFLNLRAFGFFADQRWAEIGDAYETIVDLAPRTRYYWDTGSWHLAYNAASYYIHDSTLPSLRRREEWRAHIRRGRAFLERGLRNNPRDWRLAASLGMLLTDPNKLPAFPDRDAAFAEAAAVYQAAVDTGEAPPFIRRSLLGALARVPGREKETLALAEELYHTPGNRTPTLLCLYFTARMRADPGQPPLALAREIFGSDAKAYDLLTLHWGRTKDRYPVDGVAAALAALENHLAIPPEKSVLTRPLPPPPDPGGWFDD